MGWECSALRPIEEVLAEEAIESLASEARVSHDTFFEIASIRELLLTGTLNSSTAFGGSHYEDVS